MAMFDNVIIGIDGHAEYGGPREALTKLALSADLLIVGSRGYGPLGSVFHGSVSSYLERHAQSGLLVVPRRRNPTPAAVTPDRAAALASRA
jgi:nucleotide-binding universal stress UspA family protein